MPLGGSPSYCRRLVRRNQSPTTFVDSAKASALPSPVPRQSPVPCDLSVQSAISLTTSRHHYHHHPPPIHRDRTHTYTRYALSACSSCVDTRSCSLSSTRSYSQARSSKCPLQRLSGHFFCVGGLHLTRHPNLSSPCTRRLRAYSLQFGPGLCVTTTTRLAIGALINSLPP